MARLTTKRTKIGGSTYTTRKNNKSPNQSTTKTKSTQSGQYRESVNLCTGKRTKTKLW